MDEIKKQAKKLKTVLSKISTNDPRLEYPSPHSLVNAFNAREVYRSINPVSVYRTEQLFGYGGKFNVSSKQIAKDILDRSPKSDEVAIVEIIRLLMDSNRAHRLNSCCQDLIQEVNTWAL